jgi:VIT1/CCC1 family predicted Fe2+/Mn2+ transporter
MLVSLTILLGSALVALFGVAPAVFADGPWTERTVVIVITLFLYSVLGAAAGYLRARWHWGIWVSLPAFMALFIFGDDIRLTAIYLAVLVIVACSGAIAGQWLRLRSR